MATVITFGASKRAIWIWPLKKPTHSRRGLSFLPPAGFRASVDYYNIDRRRDHVANCSGDRGRRADGKTQFCKLISRSNGVINQVRVAGVNAQMKRERGIDVELSYRTDLSLGSLNGSVTAHGLVNWIDERSITTNNEKYDYVGQYGGNDLYATPEWRGYANLDLSLDAITI